MLGVCVATDLQLMVGQSMRIVRNEILLRLAALPTLLVLSASVGRGNFESAGGVGGVGRVESAGGCWSRPGRVVCSFSFRPLLLVLSFSFSPIPSRPRVVRMAGAPCGGG